MKHSGPDGFEGSLELFVCLFAGKAEDCGAVREAFICLLSHCRGKEMAFLFAVGQSEAGTNAVFMLVLQPFVIVFMLFLFYCFVKTQRWQVKK